MSIDNLYLHADGGFYCLLSDDAPMKCPTTGAWLPGVIYMGVDGQMRSTTRLRWKERFDQVAEYDGDDEAVMNMIRRANPGSTDFDFVRTFESWHESETNITGQMLELAVAATIEHHSWNYEGRQRGGLEWDGNNLVSSSVTIKTEDLQRVAQNYEIERVAVPHGFTITLRKSFPKTG